MQRTNDLPQVGAVPPAPVYPSPDVPAAEEIGAAMQGLLTAAAAPAEAGTATLRPPALPRPAIPPLPVIKIVKQGCYLIRFIPISDFLFPFPFVHQDGTLRIELLGGVHCSGDLYAHSVFDPGPEPNPAAGVPVFPIRSYRYYLKVEPFDPITFGTLNLSFERWLFDHVTRSWTNQGTFTAAMSWSPAPAGFPDPNHCLTGTVLNADGWFIGFLTMGWVDAPLRRATVEIDRLADSEAPLANAAGTETWATAFARSLWRMDAVTSDADLTEPSGESWSDAELHAQLLASRDQNDLDAEWRYVVLAVRLLDSTERGIMFDAFATDSNNVPREGAAISSHWTIPNDPAWGTTAGQRFGAAADPYFRTAVHELGHALNLIHEESEGIQGTTFMTTTPTIVSLPGPPPFPDRITWDFHPTNKHRIKHWPDIYVRPGGEAWNAAHLTTPITTDEPDAVMATEPPGGLTVRVLPLRAGFPIGAPVRLDVEVANTGDTPVPFPSELRYEAGHLEGYVTAPGGTPRPFRSIVRCLEDAFPGVLEPGASRVASLTLLRGPDGALFATSGMHRVNVLVRWAGNQGLPLSLHGRADVWIDGARDEAHARAAATVLAAPDLSIVVALGGGEHLQEGVEALDAALAAEPLRPHYRVTQAMRLGQPFFARDASQADAVDALDGEVVATTAEIERATAMLAAGRGEPAPSVEPAASSLRAAAMDTAAGERLSGLLDGLS